MLLTKQEFASVGLHGSDRVISDLQLDRCVFTGSFVAQEDDPAFGLVVRNVIATSCKLVKCSAHGVRFEDVVIEGLATSGMTYIAGSVFKHVKLSGRVGAMMTTPPDFRIPQDIQDAFVASIKDFYKDVDWALDITDAEFSDAEFYYVPGHLVRRDEKTQFLVHRDRFVSRDLSGLPAFARHLADRFSQTPFDSFVAVAPKRSKYFEKHLAELEVLRSEGLVY